MGLAGPSGADLPESHRVCLAVAVADLQFVVLGVIFGARALHRWGEVASCFGNQGQRDHLGELGGDDAEQLLILKTTSSALSMLKARIVELHPYECPEIIAIPVTDGHAAYLDWIHQNVIVSEKR